MKTKSAPTIYSSDFLTKRGFFIEDLAKEVKRALLQDEDGEIITRMDNVIVIKDDFKDTPAFIHPVYTDDMVIIDGRPYVNAKGEFKKDPNFQLLIRRARMEAHIVENPDYLTYHDNLIVSVFSSWLSKRTSAALTLDIKAEMHLKILIAIYAFKSIHGSDMEDRPSRQVIWLLRRITKACRMPTAFINDFFELIGDDGVYGIQTMNNVAEVFNEVTDDNYRLAPSSILESVASGSFIATNASEMVAVSLENMGTFAVMLGYSLQGGIHHQTNLGRIVKSDAKAHNPDRFVKALEVIEVL